MHVILCFWPIRGGRRHCFIFTVDVADEFKEVVRTADIFDEEEAFW